MKVPKKNYGRMAKKALKAKPTKKALSSAINKVKVDGIKAIVKSVMNKTEELKYTSLISLADNIQIAGSGLLYDGVLNLRGWSSGPAIPTGIIPLIVQGDGQGDRDGNTIRPKDLVLKYSCYALPTDEGTNPVPSNPYKGIPFFVRVIVYRHKYGLDDYSQTNILEIGNGATSFGSGIDNFFRPYNTSEYTVVYSKSIKMTALKHTNYTTGLTTTENVPNGAVTFYQSSAKIPLPSVLKYNDNANSPTNQNYFLAVCLCNEDGSVVTAGTHKRLQFNAEANMTFYDS